MRIRVDHETVYRYGVPAKSVIQSLRLTPRNHDGQFVARWRIDVSVDCRMERGEDAFGNVTHAFSVDGPIVDLAVRVTGEVETEDTAGIVRDAVERFPVALYRRETDLTTPDAAMRAYASDIAATSQPDRLTLLHDLMTALHRDIIFDTDPTHAATTATEAFALKRGVCQDITHMFLAMARHLGVPSRYVSGYLLREDGVVSQTAGHAWAEAHVEGFGWVAFDPANDVCPKGAHVRVATGLDYLGAAPVRGSRYGGEGEFLGVRVVVDQANRQVQG
jgi:transglutaminase-like putative cysteine protease